MIHKKSIKKSFKTGACKKKKKPIDFIGIITYDRKKTTEKTIRIIPLKHRRNQYGKDL